MYAVAQPHEHIEIGQSATLSQENEEKNNNKNSWRKMREREGGEGRGRGGSGWEEGGEGAREGREKEGAFQVLLQLGFRVQVYRSDKCTVLHSHFALVLSGAPCYGNHAPTHSSPPMFVRLRVQLCFPELT